MPNNITINGSPSYPAAATGFGQCVALNGTNTWLSTASQLGTATGVNFTVRMRVKVNGLPASGNAIIAASAGGEFSWVIGINSSGQLLFNVNGFNANATVTQTTASANDGAWHTLALVVDNSGSGNASLYVDGSVPAGLNGGTGSYTQSTTAPFLTSFGAYYGGSAAIFFANVTLDEIAVFNATALSGSTNLNPTAPTANNAAGLTALWHLDAGNAVSATFLDCAGATFSVSPTSGPTATALTFTGTGTQWTTVAPAFTLTGASNSVTSQAVTTAAAATGTTATATSGAQTLTDLSSGWTAAFSVGSGPPATSFTLTGPSAGPAGAASSNFTVTPTGGTTSGTFTPTVISGVSYSPTTLTWTGDAAAKTFTVNKTVAGTISVNGTFSTGETPPASVSYTAKATTTYIYTVTGGTAGTSTTYAIKNLDGTDFHAATTTGVTDLGGGAYSVLATVPTDYAGTIVWAQGSVLAAETLPPPSSVVYPVFGSLFIRGL